MRKSLVPMLLVGLIALNGNALTTGKRFVFLEDILHKYEHALHVKILSSQLIEFNFGGSSYDCGIVYRAHVIEVLGQGVEGEYISFSSVFSLKTNTEYLVFLTSRPQLYKRLNQIQSTEEGFLTSVEVANCVANLPKYNTDGSGVAFEFGVVNGRQTSTLIHSDITVILPEWLSTEKREFLFCKDSTTRGEQCNVIYMYRVFEWDDLKTRYTKD